MTGSTRITWAIVPVACRVLDRIGRLRRQSRFSLAGASKLRRWPLRFRHGVQGAFLEVGGTFNGAGPICVGDSDGDGTCIKACLRTIPAVSDWGLVVLVLVLPVLGKLYYGRRGALR